jgi:histidyl-tRNA synthetase
MSDLVHVKKAGEPVLRILREHLGAHQKLGWQEVDTPAVPETRAAEKAEPDQQDVKVATKDSKGK